MNRLTERAARKWWSGPLLMRNTRWSCDKVTSLAPTRRAIHVFFTYDKKEHDRLLSIKRYDQGRDKSKMVLLDVEKCEGEKIKKKIHKYLIGGVILSSICICLIEFDVVTSLYGYLLSFGLLAFYTLKLYSWKSVVLRAVLDVKNRHLLLYPFKMISRQGMKKQIILSLHEIKFIRTDGNFIKMYFKGHSLLSFLFQYNMVTPLCMPRYTCAQTSEPAKEDTDVLYHYDYNNLNVSAFGQRNAVGTRAVGEAAAVGSVGALPRVRKNAEGYPLDVAEEAKLLSLLRGA
ncbi:hypothetical protein AK88_03591 [Plasmodium fragile]|uniref:Uncharacterized protein n=1 Tax=Plasmodium fragile TaxID=5857 RepID=A0A0D9QJ09_PLAFR|nr:uncharacterized protein AK88_03591 [Plasmodium fragile]KJP86777.1 hypothetical protein AK88_03591 [Plasmodium fragile]